MQPELLNRYLGLLGVPRRDPSLDGLHELVKAHLFSVPFENLSKLYYKSQRGLMNLPGLELYLDGIERYNFGGTCYPNNYYFYQLLANLGYRVMLCGADMANPDVHLVSMVDLEGRQYLVDVGYAAPFAIPLPRDLQTDHVVGLGHDRYVLKPQDSAGCSRLELHRNGKLTHGYMAKPVPREIDEFAEVIIDSYRAKATFMNALLLARFFPGRSLVIHNLTVIESRGSSATMSTLADTGELVDVIATHFDIPPHIGKAAVDGLVMRGDAWN